MEVLSNFKRHDDVNLKLARRNCPCPEAEILVFAAWELYEKRGAHTVGEQNPALHEPLFTKSRRKACLNCWP